ncbi:hypothetical protein GEV33_015450 [Tenebrio molitor]|uniref:Uncharacterized protein n=1 Tax=Tenebrio molitor TaxID=7067 RepID=A0A8J6H3J0_TENMO|nr:hypothetical protein GEV33_015450 [Tenebrio molitor]
MNREKYHEVIKVCALEHDLSVLQFGDGTLVGEQGAMLSGGQKARISLARAIYRDADIYLLDDPLSAVDAHVAQYIFSECIIKYLKDKCVILVTHQVQYLKDEPRLYQLNRGTLCRLKKSKELQPSTFTVKNIEQVSDAQTLHESLKNDAEPSEVKEHRSTGNSFKKIYGVYFRAGGNWLVTCVILFSFVLIQCCASCIEFFLSHWVNLVQEHERFETESERMLITHNCVYIYSGLLLCLVLVTITATWAFVHYCMIASKNLHNSMLNKIIDATMTFFNNHPSGRILNRFSKDVGNVDESVPLSLIIVIVTFLNLIAMFVTIFIMNYWMILPTALLLLICGVFAAVFQPSNRNMKRREGVTKSSIYTHLGSSLQGLTTIRAFNAQELLQNQFDKHQDVHSAAYYMYLAIYNAFAFWTDFISTIYVGIVIFSFFFITSDVRVGNIGLALIQLFQIELIQYAMKIWSDLETQMTSVERVNDYTELTPETQSGQGTPPKSWPTNGKIYFNKISMKYTQNGPFVLYNVSFKIQAGEKIGIVGRTGAGKTSIVSALFRLYDFDGSITIDEVDSKSISPNDLRSKIAIIPQQPVLFFGTLRKNLDLFDEFDDSQLWSALEDVKLKDMLSDLPSGLDTMILEGGENFSLGQKQLLCLVRAMLRNVKIVVMDEATANVDLSTDALIQATIRRKFRQCTVITIAHRLDTVMDSDKILVLESGRVVEFDAPESGMTGFCNNSKRDVLIRWELPLILKGGSKDFTEDDLSGPLDSHESKQLADKLELAWLEEEKRKIPSLGRVLLSLFGTEFATYAIVFFPLHIGFMLIRPYFLKKLLRYYTPKENDVTLQKAYTYAGLLVFATFADLIVYHWYMMGLSALGMKIRVACCSLIYRKCLKQRTGVGLEVGKLINLLSNDANRFDLALPMIHFVWMAPVAILAEVLYLYFVVDSTATAGVAVLVLSLLFEIYLSKKISTNRMRVALKTDYRIRLMNDIVSGIQVIKMYAWEKPFSRLVNVARVLEIQEILRANLSRSINYILPTFLKHICIYLCVLAATLVGVPLLSSFVFVVELLYNDLNNSVFVYLPVAVTQLAELRVSIKRIEDFLVSPVEKSLMKTNRRSDKKVDNCTLISVQQESCSILQNRSTGVYLENIRVKWNRSLTTNILNGVNFSAQMGELIGIIGASGSGKSTLLQTILKEVDPIEGSIDVRGVVSYASQDPWFFSDSIRNNILFGKAMNREKYHEVVKSGSRERC